MVQRKSRGAKPQPSETLLTATPDILGETRIYLSHLAAVSRGLEFMADHYESFAKLLPDGWGDDVEATEIAEAIRNLANKVWNTSYGITWNPTIPEGFYLNAVREKIRKSSYVDFQSLADFVAAFKRNEEAQVTA